MHRLSLRTENWELRTALLFQLLADFFQCSPTRIIYVILAGALALIQILPAMRAQPFAIVATDRLQRHGQQDLLAQSIFKQHALTLVIADLGFGIGNGELFVPGIGPEGSKSRCS